MRVLIRGSGNEEQFWEKRKLQGWKNAACVQGRTYRVENPAVCDLMDVMCPEKTTVSQSGRNTVVIIINQCISGVKAAAWSQTNGTEPPRSARTQKTVCWRMPGIARPRGNHN